MYYQHESFIRVHITKCPVVFVRLEGLGYNHGKCLTCNLLFFYKSIVCLTEMTFMCSCVVVPNMRLNFKVISSLSFFLWIYYLFWLAAKLTFLIKLLNAENFSKSNAHECFQKNFSTENLKIPYKFFQT